MNSIWIIIFIIVMIFKALNKEQQTGKGKGTDWGKWDQTGLPPVFSEGRFPDLYHEEMEPAGLERDVPLPEKDKRNDERPNKRISMMPEREPAKIYQTNFREQEQLDGISTQLLEINQSTLINAVIMSEILQPPVSKRKQKKRF